MVLQQQVHHTLTRDKLGSTAMVSISWRPRHVCKGAIAAAAGVHCPLPASEAKCSALKSVAPVNVCIATICRSTALQGLHDADTTLHLFTARMATHFVTVTK